MKGEEIIFAAHGNEALVQNGLLFKFFMGLFFVSYSFSPKFVSDQFIVVYNIW